MGIAIRAAVPGDEYLILDFIKELAEYENAQEQVQLSTSQIREELEKENPLFGCLLALEYRQPIGFAFYYYIFSTWVGKCMHLEDLYVEPASRRSGAGRHLFRRLVSICRVEGLKRMDWEVLEWNTSAHNFYKKMGAHCRSDWRSWRLEF